MTDNPDLAHLTWQELTEERARLRTRSREIHAERAVTGRPDDRLYRRWRRSINAEQSAILDRLDAISAEFSRRAPPRPARPKGPPVVPSPDLEERRRRLRAAIAEGGPDALLIGYRRLFSRLWSGRDLDEVGLTPEEQDTLRAISLYLRDRYGSTPVKEAMQP